MQKNQIQSLFSEFLKDPTYAIQVEQTIQQNSKIFRQFWSGKITNTNVTSLNDENDLDPIIQLLDAKAKGNKGRRHFAIAATGIRQGMWRRLFKSFKSNLAIQTKMD